MGCSRQTFRDHPFFLEIRETLTLETLTCILTELFLKILKLEAPRFSEPNETRFPDKVNKLS